MPRVVVDGRSLHVDTGGPEALAQLAVALGPQTFLLRPSKAPPIAPRLAREYPSIGRLAILRETRELLAHDIFIVPEKTLSPNNHNCEERLTRRRVRVWIWLLSTRTRRTTHKFRAQGCNLFAHSHHTAEHLERWDPAYGFRTLPPLDIVIRPYISPSTVKFCRSTRNSKPSGTPLVLLDSDTDATARARALRACHDGVCRVELVKGLSRSQVTERLIEASVVVDLCPIGSERLPIEAVLCGADMITSACMNGEDERDFPLDASLRLNDATALTSTLQSVLKRRAAAWSGSAALRRLYDEEIGPASMAREAAAALAAMRNSSSPLPRIRLVG